MQLTNTGNAKLPAISEDGKTLAYVVTACGKSGCRYGVDIKDVGGSESRRIVDGATAIYNVKISPDRRNVLFLGSMNGVYGTFITSMVGGAPRYLLPGLASFYAGGDSLLLARTGPASKSFSMLVSGIDGVVADSIMIDQAVDGPVGFGSIPGSNRIGVRMVKDGVVTFSLMERTGTMLSSFSLERGVNAAGWTSRDALWVYANPPARDNALVLRIPFDPETMKLASRGDTVYVGNATAVSVTADGAQIVIDEGSTDYTAWTLPLEDLVNDKFTDDKRLTRATGELRGSISPDGRMVVVGKGVSQGGVEYAVIPSGTTTEIPIPGRHRTAVPLDSVTLKISDITSDGVSLYLYNYRTRRRSSPLVVNDPALRDFTRLGNDSWAWVPSNGLSIKIQRDGESTQRTVKIPTWYKDIYWVSGSKDGSRISFVGWQAPVEDSLGIGIISIADNRFTQAFATFAENATSTWLDDGGLYITIDDTPESATLYRWQPDGRMQKIGSTPRVVAQGATVTASSDLKKAFMISRDDRRDVWLSKVVK